MLTLDASNGGSATFRDDIDLAGSINMTGSSKVIKLNGGGYIDFDSTNLQFNTQRNPNTGTFNDTAKSHAHIGLQGASGGSQIIFGTAAAANTTATTCMTITSGGRVGIGTPSPQDYDGESDDLVVAQGVNGTNPTPGITIACLANQASSGRGAIRFADGTSGNERYRGAVEYQHGGDDMFFRTSGSIQMAIDSAGNVGIGNTDPLQKLDTPNIVIGGSTISGTYRANALFIDNNAGQSRFYSTGADGSTYGSYKFNIVASDGAPNAAVLTLGADFNAEFAGTIASGNINISDGTPVLTLTDTSSSATVTHTLDGVDYQIANNGSSGNFKLSRKVSTTERVFLHAHDNGNLYLYGTGSLAQTISGADTTFAGDVILGDDKELIFGGATDFKIYHNSTTNVNHVSSQLDRQLSINGNIIKLTNQANNSTYLSLESTGATFAGSVKYNGELQVFSGATDIGQISNLSGALNIQGTSTRDVSLGSDTVPQALFIEGTDGNATFAGNVALAGEDQKATFGTSADLEIYHSGSDSYIRDVGTGSLRITASRFTVLNAANDETMIDVSQNAGVLLYYNNSNVLETVAIGSQTKFDGGGAAIGHTIHNEGIAAGDDAKIAFETQGAMDWAIGIDRSDSNSFKISRHENLGTNDVVTLTTNDATFAGDVAVNGGRITITESGNQNELLIMNASSDVYADQVWADSGGSIRLRSHNGAFKIYTDGDANSLSANNSTEGFSLSTSQNATFAGACKS